nr:hypothetical protein [Tepidiphilus baoligensis]
MIVRTGTSSSGARLPSTSTSSGTRGNAATARAIARSVARRMFHSSISEADASATAQASALARISAASRSRRLGLSFFESFKPDSEAPGGRITAAATTGPASGPRPASSTPQR